MPAQPAAPIGNGEEWTMMRMWRKEIAGLLFGVMLGSAWQVATASPGTFVPPVHRAAPAR